MVQPGQHHTLEKVLASLWVFGIAKSSLNSAPRHDRLFDKKRVH